MFTYFCSQYLVLFTTGMVPRIGMKQVKRHELKDTRRRKVNELKFRFFRQSIAGLKNTTISPVGILEQKQQELKLLRGAIVNRTKIC